MIKKLRPKDLGLLFVVGGPGSSGSSTISKMLADIFSLRRVYGGGFFRDVVRDLGYLNLEEAYVENSLENLEGIDMEVDRVLREESKKKDIIIDSKIFAALATQEDIPCTVKIWLDSSLHVRTLRCLHKEEISNIFKKIIRYFKIRKDLENRFRLDGERYQKIYDVDYFHPEKYYDLVLDTSHLDEKETVDLILEEIKNGGYITKE